MRFFTSWTHSDPAYQAHLSEVRLLVSPPNVNLSWHISRWPSMPAELMLDSGAYQYRHGGAPEPAAVLKRQLAMIDQADMEVGICHVDAPLVGVRSAAEAERRVLQSLTNARWLIGRALAGELPERVRPIGVIQGESVERVYYVGRALADMGYSSFALGSVAGMVASARGELLRRAEAALEAVGADLHVLGVGAAPALRELARAGVASADSGAPSREAWRGGLLYSRPFRRYKIDSPHFREWSRSYSFAEILAAPLRCECPVCSADSSRLMEPRGKEYVNLRAIHNCYHLARELSAEGQ